MSEDEKHPLDSFLDSEPLAPEAKSAGRPRAKFIMIEGSMTPEELMQWHEDSIVNPKKLIDQLLYCKLMPGFFGLPEKSVNAKHGASFQLADEITFEEGLAQLKERFGVEMTVGEYIELMESM
jgi:hypothetical protein